MRPQVAVADLGALLRWSGQVGGAAPQCDAVVCPDALVAEVLEYLRVLHDGRLGPMLADLANVELSVDRFYDTSSMAATVAELATLTPSDLDVALCTPVALAAKLELPLVTTSPELAVMAAAHVPQVVLLRR